MKIARTALVGLFAILGALLAAPAHADDWPMFGRTLGRNAVNPEKAPPTSWRVRIDDDAKPASKNVLWSSIMGSGHSYYGTCGDPVVVGARVWIGTNADVGKDAFYALNCLDAKTGKLLYQYRTPLHPQIGWERWLHTMGTSPAIEGDRMWFFTNRAEVVCLDLAPLNKGQGDPREVWKVDTRKEFGVYRTKSIFDCRFCSVAVHGDSLFVITGNGVNNWDGKGRVNADAPSLICLNKNTGKVIWSDNSPGDNILHGQFASPTVFTVNGKTQIVAPQGDGWVRSFDAATGKLIWKFDTNPPDAKWDPNGRGDRNYLPATAVFHDNRIFIGNGQEPEMRTGSAYLYCIDATKSGDISPCLADGQGKSKPNPASGEVWKYGSGGDRKTRIFNRTLSNVAIHEGLLLATDINGTVHCLDERTGKKYWTHETDSSIRTSPLIVDGFVYVGDEDGIVWIFQLAKEKKIVNQIETGHRIRASPVFANGVLYIASGHTVYAIAGDKCKE